MTTTTGRIQDFYPIDANDGIAITKAGKRYEVWVDGRFFAGSDTLWAAMQAVEVARAAKVSKG